MDMSEDCKREVMADEVRTSQDYRLNFRLKKACEKDVSTLCADVCPAAENGHPCGGLVLRCLTDKQDQIANGECKNEVCTPLLVGQLLG
jgi:golgi apparatus protein 1